MKKLVFPLLITLGLLFAGCGGGDNGTNGNGNGNGIIITRVVADTAVASAPDMSDVNWSGWYQVDSELVEIGGDPTNYGMNPNLGKQDVTMRAIVKSDTLYIWARWHDASANLWANYSACVLVGNFSPVTSEGEDRFLIIFDALNNGDEGADCATTCHATAHMTMGGGNIDAWKWMSTKTAPGFMAEDEWWDGSGRLEDATDLNMYVYRRNWSGDIVTKYPYWMHVTDTAFNEPFLYAEDAITYNSGMGWEVGIDRIPGYKTDSTIHSDPSRGSSSMWDVAAVSEFDSTGAFSDWTWTIVLARALNTGHSDDVDLSAVDSVQVTIAATHNDNEAADPSVAHSGSKPFYIIFGEP